VNECELAGGSVGQLGDAIAGMSRLQILDLSLNALSVAGCWALSRGLAAVAPTLRVLLLDECSALYGEAVEALVASPLPSLRVLGLVGGHEPGPGGLSAVAGALGDGRLPALRLLRMRSGGEGDEGARTVAAALPRALELQELELFWTARLTNTGAMEIGRALPRAHRLRKLTMLGMSSVSQRGVDALARGARAAPGLRELWVRATGAWESSPADLDTAGRVGWRGERRLRVLPPLEDEWEF